MPKITATLILLANDQCTNAWREANTAPIEFTRIDIAEWYLYARISGKWQHMPMLKN